jgi:hypothetical protein
MNKINKRVISFITNSAKIIILNLSKLNTNIYKILFIITLEYNKIEDPRFK